MPLGKNESGQDNWAKEMSKQKKNGPREIAMEEESLILKDKDVG